MKREIIYTADGSVTLHLPDWDETYHSKHGAIQEANHVFIKNGLALFENKPVDILEVGFGTGLNCFLTYLHRMDSELTVNYTGLEAFPVSADDASKLNYAEILSDRNAADAFRAMHSGDWADAVALKASFHLKRIETKFEDFSSPETFDLIYYDAFGFRVQPELWSEPLFKIMYDALRPGGILVTYASRTIIRKNLKAAGFRVETLQGPPGKREMTRVFKD